LTQAILIKTFDKSNFTDKASRLAMQLSASKEWLCSMEIIRSFVRFLSCAESEQANL
jgi:hypothetical protein